MKKLWRKRTHFADPRFSVRRNIERQMEHYKTKAAKKTFDGKKLFFSMRGSAESPCGRSVKGGRGTGQELLPVPPLTARPTSRVQEKVLAQMDPLRGFRCILWRMESSPLTHTTCNSEDDHHEDRFWGGNRRRSFDHLSHMSYVLPLYLL